MMGDSNKFQPILEEKIHPIYRGGYKFFHALKTQTKTKKA